VTAPLSAPGEPEPPVDLPEVDFDDPVQQRVYHALTQQRSYTFSTLAAVAIKASGLAEVTAERDGYKAHILDIDAHATPFGDLPDEPGFTGMYLLTAGALHRALGTIGHTSPSCAAEADRDRYKAALEAVRDYNIGDNSYHGDRLKEMAREALAEGAKQREANPDAATGINPAGDGHDHSSTDPWSHGPNGDTAYIDGCQIERIRRETA
jgi:hypothetical protein